MGAVGSLLLDWYGWESVFYFSGALTLFWVYSMWKYLLNKQGKCSFQWTQTDNQKCVKVLSILC